MAVAKAKATQPKQRKTGRRFEVRDSRFNILGQGKCGAKISKFASFYSMTTVDNKAHKYFAMSSLLCTFCITQTKLTEKELIIVVFSCNHKKFDIEKCKQ